MMGKKRCVWWCLLFLSGSLAAQPIHIWQDTPVRDKSVILTPYLPANGNGAAVIICPGGSYFWLDDYAESRVVAKWLSDNGFDAFVLKYRTSGWPNFVFGTRAIFGGPAYPAMLEDVQRAMQCVRENAAAYGVERLGLMGFSAGGHLVMLASEFFDTDFLSPHGIRTDVSLRPDFVATIYPVVTMREHFVHKRSRRGLLGGHSRQTRQMLDSLSLEKHVRPDCPPVFLVHCEDDTVVDPRNSELLEASLRQAGVAHRYIRFKSGGHGFGALASLQNDETCQWQDFFLDWVRGLEDASLASGSGRDDDES